jgi:preprotein translocase subunit SecA
MNHGELAETLVERVKKRYAEKDTLYGEPMMRWLERRIILDIVDTQWKYHLLTLDHLKEGIGLRGYGQKDPLVEFKKEAFTLFEDMMGRIDTETVRYLFLVQPARPEDEAREIERRQRRQQQQMQLQAGAAQAAEPPARPHRSKVDGTTCALAAAAKIQKVIMERPLDKFLKVSFCHPELARICFRKLKEADSSGKSGPE